MYTQNLSGCQINNSNRHVEALNTFRTAYNQGHLAPLALVTQRDDLKTYQDAAQQLSQFDDVLILGTGGSSLGGKTLCTLSSQNAPRLHFLDNIDPNTFERLFAIVHPQKTGVLAISKSGSTVETLFQLLTCLQHIDNTHVMVITEPTQNPLRKLANEHQWTCLDHPTNVGGRYSCFSIVGLIPAILAGLDAQAIREGAQTVLEQHLNEDFPPALQGAALMAHHNKPMTVMLPYADQLDSFALWYRQLWAESVGKNGKGSTPIKALGTVDQHSQLQLYLDGPKDKFFTLIAPEWKGRGEKITSMHLPEFTGKTMGDLFDAEFRATYETLVRNQCPTRLITVDTLNERSLGALLMHFMIETVLMSYIIEVNAFDQPAVEEGKILAREYLAA